jgi:hypothetical protein
MPVPSSNPARLLIRGTIEIPVEMPRLLFLRSERPKDEIKGRIAQHAVNLS